MQKLRRSHIPNMFISPAGKPFRAVVGAPYPVAVWFAAADTNHDGRLSREEFISDAMAFFHELDTNHDGLIEGSEIANYEQNIAPEILPNVGALREGEGLNPNLDIGDAHNTGRRSDQDDRRSRRSAPSRPARTGAGSAQGAALFSLLNEPEPIAAADLDFDGRISLVEFQATAERRFGELDTQGRGYLTAALLPKTPVQEALQKESRSRVQADEPTRGPPAE